MRKSRARTYIEESIQVKQECLSDDPLLQAVEKAAVLLRRTVKGKNKVLIAGNGGSASDSMHFATELVCTYRRKRRPYAAVALAQSATSITAWGNDYNFDAAFSRQLEALGCKKDVFVAISTSGNSANILDALKTARRMGIKSIGLLGKGGGRARNLCDIPIIVPSHLTSHVQEVHITLIHLLCEFLES